MITSAMTAISVRLPVIHQVNYHLLTSDWLTTVQRSVKKSLSVTGGEIVKDMAVRTLMVKELQVGQSFSLRLPFARDNTLKQAVFNEDGTMTLHVTDWMGRPTNPIVVSPERKVYVSPHES